MNGDGTQRTDDARVEMAAEPAMPDRPVRDHSDVLQLIADVEHQLERLRAAQVRSAEEYAHFADRGRRLDEREHAINGAAAMLTARESQLHAMTDALRDEEIRLAERQRQLDLAAGALDHRASEVERRASEIERGATELESARSSIDAARTALDADRSRIAEERELFDRERQAMAGARDLADGRLGALETEITTLNERLSSLQRERDELRSSQSESADALAAAERNAVSLMMAITLLREQVADAESSLASRDSVVDSKDAVIADRERTIAERDRKVAELDHELEVSRHDLRAAGDKLAALAKSLADQAPQLERGAAALALAHEHRQELLAKDKRIAQLETELAGAIEAAQAVPADVVDAEAAGAAAAELVAAREEIDRLQSEIVAARSAADRERDANRSSAADAERAIGQTQQKLNEALAFLGSRKRRIDLARRLHRERKVKREREVRQAAENGMVRVLEEERLVKKQREELRQVQEMLTATERSMLHRYARHRGGLVAAWCLIVIVGVAAGSWYAADSVLPKVAVASVDLTAKVREGEQISPEADTAFQSAHREALGNAGFREAVKRRLADRGVTALKGNGEFDRWLDGVDFDSDGPGSLRLIAEGPDPQTAVVALDTLATTLVNESPKLAKGKGDVPRATIVGNTQVPGRISFSTIVPQQGPLDRIISAGMVFSAVMTVGLIAGVVTFGRIARAKRRFEDAERFGATL